MEDFTLRLNGKLYQVRNQLNYLRKLSGEFEFGKTGTIKITTVDKEYKLYSSADYADKIKRLNSIVANYYKPTVKEEPKENEQIDPCTEETKTE